MFNRPSKKTIAVVNNNEDFMKICIIGAGWYGCHLARILASKGHDVTLAEKNSDIFTGISGNFGIRLHKGPHYPRSKETREGCQRGFTKFFKYYPDLIVRHGYSIYALGMTDADGKLPKVTQEEFEKVCQEDKDCKQIDSKKWHFNDLITAMDIPEPSILLGQRLRDTFKILLKDAKVTVKCNFEVKKLVSVDNQVLVSTEDSSEIFDYVINATSYHSLTPNSKSELPFKLDVVYQPCLALVYEDKTPEPLPFSFIVLDGWFPCMMPYVEDDPIKESKEGHRRYILTHGKWTILGSCNSPTEAQNIIDKLTDDFITKNIKPNCEHEINRFFPEFNDRFHYSGWKSAVLAKLRTNREFRSAVTFEEDRIIHIIPGKVSNIFDVAKEVKALIRNENTIKTGNYKYIKDGVLDRGASGSCEIIEPIHSFERNTCSLQTYEEIVQKKMLRDKKNQSTENSDSSSFSPKSS